MRLVRPGRLALIGLALLVIAIVARAQFRQPDEPVDPALGLSARTVVPGPVLSTLRRACFDCHSNETRWPWYSRLPIASWLIERDVEAGRGQLNFSRWAQYNRFVRAELLDKVCDRVTAGEMPLRPYLMLHGEARLSPPDVAGLCEWSRSEATRLLTTAVRFAAQIPDGSDGWRIPESAATEQNPVPVNPAAIARGKSLYQSKCQRCHGTDGTGRGPDADPSHAPADLTDARRASRNPDGVLFYKIWNGRARPKMPAMKSDVSVTDAWMIVHYVKTLRK